MGIKKTATVVLGGGSALGLAHIGVLSILEQNFEIKAIVGTSMGAIVGALYASGLDTDSILEIASRQSNAKVFSPFNLDTRIRGIFDGHFVYKLFTDWTSKMNIEEGRIPFMACAYDLNSRCSVLFDKGLYADAMRASSSIPFIFAPFRFGSYLFVDGGIEYPLPIAFADLFENELVIAVNVLPSVANKATLINPGSYTKSPTKRIHRSEIVLQSVLNNQAYLALKDTTTYEPAIVIEAAMPEARPYAFHKSKAFYDYGRLMAVKTLSEYKEPHFIDKIRKHYVNLTSKGHILEDIS
jgi:NTE family protein